MVSCAVAAPGAMVASLAWLPAKDPTLLVGSRMLLMNWLGVCAASFAAALAAAPVFATPASAAAIELGTPAAFTPMSAVSAAAPESAAALAAAVSAEPAALAAEIPAVATPPAIAAILAAIVRSLPI